MVAAGHLAYYIYGKKESSMKESMPLCAGGINRASYAAGLALTEDWQS